MAGDSHLLLSYIAHSEASGNGSSLKPVGNVSHLLVQGRVEPGLLWMGFLTGRLSYVMPGLNCAELAGHAGLNNRPSRPEECCRSCSRITCFSGPSCLLSNSSCRLKGKGRPTPLCVPGLNPAVSPFMSHLTGASLCHQANPWEDSVAQLAVSCKEQKTTGCFSVQLLVAACCLYQDTQRVSLVAPCCAVPRSLKFRLLCCIHCCLKLAYFFSPSFPVTPPSAVQLG